MNGKLWVVAVLLSVPSPVYAGVDVRVDVPSPVVVAPLVVAQPSVDVNVDVPPPLVLAEPPQLIFSPALGYYVAVGIAQDIVLIDNIYYMHRHGRWFMSDSYNGNWAFVDRGRLPGGLRMHNWNYIRGYRDREYRNYRRDPNHYRGRFYDHRGGDHHAGDHKAGGHGAGGHGAGGHGAGGHGAGHEGKH